MSGMRRFALPVLAALAVLGPAAALRAQPVNDASPLQPGWWEFKTKVLGLTVESDKRCIDAEDVAKFMTGPCNRHHTCTYPVKEFANGKALFDGYWQDKKGRRAKVRATGNYTLKTFNLDAKGTTTQGIPMAATMNARWLSATCPDPNSKPKAFSGR